VKALNVGYPVAVDSDTRSGPPRQQLLPPLFICRCGRPHPRSALWRRQLRGIERYPAAAEGGRKTVGNDMVSVDPRGLSSGRLGQPQVTGELPRLGADGELAFRVGRNGPRRTYTAPAELRRNQWALAGGVDHRAEAFNSIRLRGGSYRFHARDLHLVMGPLARHADSPGRSSMASPQARRTGRRR
jgi:hypothetical protein